jgi:RimJ/RimL family protein N-acetyltransferase
MNLFHGQLVKLTAFNADADLAAFARWSLDAEYDRLLDSAPARQWTASQLKEGAEKWFYPPENHEFVIRALADDRLLGSVGLGVDWAHGDAFVGIGLGERGYWGRGYGSDALRVSLRYAFTELNLHRVTLNVFAYNARAVRSYEKSGFVVEGRVRQHLNRDGRRWDMIYMGILKEEWQDN